VGGLAPQAAMNALATNTVDIATNALGFDIGFLVSLSRQKAAAAPTVLVGAVRRYRYHRVTLGLVSRRPTRRPRNRMAAHAAWCSGSDTPVSGRRKPRQLA
jgi:hypothetical protein